MTVRSLAWRAACLAAMTVTVVSGCASADRRSVGDGSAGSASRPAPVIDRALTASPSSARGEQAVLLHVPAPQPGDADLGLADLQDAISSVIRPVGGEVDGNDISLADDDSIIYCYGPSAEAMWQAMLPTLRREHLPRGTYALEQFGPAGSAPTRRVEIT